MARSVLPSTARSGARFARRRSHKQARQAARATLRRLQHADHPDDVDDPLDRYTVAMSGDFNRHYEEWLVEARRSADKVGPLVRWAGATIDRSPELCDGDYWTRRNHFKALLPDTLPGRHAVSHLEHLFGPKGDWQSIYSWQAWEHRQVEERRWLMAGSEDCKARPSAVLAGAGTRRLNKRISALTPPTEPVVRQVHDGSDRVEKPTFVPVEPWLYTGEDSDRWLGKPRSRHARTIAPLRGNPTADVAHRALDEVFAEMFGGRLPDP